MICAAFSYPPTAFIHQMNRATAEQHEHQTEEEGLEPIKQSASDLFNDVIEQHFGTSELEFAWSEEDEIDQSKQAEILSTYVGSAVMTANEAREQLGLDPSPEPNAGKLGIKTATGFVPLDRGDDAAGEERAADNVVALPNRGSR